MILLYGANGYTGQLIIQRALEKGLKPIIAGRNAPLDSNWRNATTLTTGCLRSIIKMKFKKD